MHLLLASLLLTSTTQTSDPRSRLEPFELNQVRLLDGLEKREQEADRRYLKSLPVDDLMWTMRKNAGLPTPGITLGGWEAPSSEIRGTFVGHYLTTCALMFGSTSDPFFRDRANQLVDEIDRCRKAVGPTFIGAIPATYLDRVETGKPIWAPYYVVEKLITGLLDVNQTFGNKKALAMAESMAKYLRQRSAKLTDKQFVAMMRVEYGGMAQMEYNLYSIDHEKANLDFAHRWDEQAILAPLARKEDKLSGIHANTNLPKIMGAARRYELLDDHKYRELVEYFWDRVVNHHSYATGGNNKAEFWGDPDALAHSLVTNNQETCTTYNMLKITRKLIGWTGDAKYGDFYERAYINGILPVQRPDNGQMIYYMPLAGGDTKNWGTPHETFWCCYCTGIESFAKLNDSIYFHDKDSVYVNLFVPSELTWKAKGFALTQKTDFPEAEDSTFTVHLRKPTKMAINLRVPYWTDGFHVTINGRLVPVAARKSHYMKILRPWEDGDMIRVEMPMHLHTEPMPDDPTLQAVMYGPTVLAGVMTPKTPIADDVNTGYLRTATYDPTQWLQKKDGQLAFRTVGQKTNLDFVPLYDIIDQRFGVYWWMVKPGSERDRQLTAAETSTVTRNRRIVDELIVDEGPNEQAHHLQATQSGSGPFNGRHWRDGKSFSWEFKVYPDSPMTLGVTYWGDDGPPRTFDIIVNGEKIATQSLNHDRSGKLFEVEYAIPARLTANADNKIRVEFRAHEGNTAGGVFGVATMRAK